MFRSTLWVALTCAIFSASAGLADTAGPERRPSWLDTGMPQMPEITNAPVRASADAEVLPAAEPVPSAATSLDRAIPVEGRRPIVADDPNASLSDRVGEELDRLDDKARQRELQVFAREAVAAGRPDLFRRIMAAHDDANWKNLPDGLTALNMIAWMPDTAEFLPTRISLARYLGEIGELDFEEQTYLWKDLRARVERVGNPDYLHALLLGMAETGHSGLLRQTLARLYGTSMEQFDALVSVLDDPAARLNAGMQLQLLQTLDDIWDQGVSSRRDPERLATLHLASGNRQRASDLIATETDGILRLRGYLGLYIAQEQSEAALPHAPIDMPAGPR